MVRKPEISGIPDYQDLKNFSVASMVLALAFSAFYGDFTDIGRYPFFILGSASVLFFRELGVRSAVNLLDGYVDLELAGDGCTTTLFGGIMAVVSGLPLILLFPVYSSVSRKQYENWGKSTDVIWALYKFKVAKWSVSGLFLGYIIFYSLGLNTLAQMTALFTFFQMMPFDYSGIPTGPLDGAEIIRWSGFYWLTFTGLSILAIAFTM